MTFYRLCKRAHVALDGEGARLYGGRWNSPGRPMIYAAATASLAVLEVLVHLDLPPELVPDDYRLLSIDVPDAIAGAALDSVPDGDADCRAIGDRFLDDCRTVALRVPSIVVPQERNVLLNPRHADIARVSVAADEPFRIDPRLLGSIH